MRLLPVLSLLQLVSCANIIVVDGTTIVDGRTMTGPFGTTITASASYSACSGNALTQWQSCSSSADAEIDKCDDTDVKCECQQASKAYACLVSACPSETSEICASSVIVNDFCRLAGMSSSSISIAPSCPTVDIGEIIKTLVPDIPSDIRSLLPSQIQSLIAQSSASARSTASATSAVASAAATSTGGAADKIRVTGVSGSLNSIVGAGAVISIVIGALAAFL